MKVSLKVVSVILVGVLLVAGFAGCAGTASKEEAPKTEAPKTEAPKAEEPKAAKLEGKVIIDGSGTVYPLMANIAEEYMTNVQPNVSVQVGRAGSSAGFKKFIPGETDFSDASRKIKDEEAAKLKENGTEFLEFKVALDGLTMVINKENTWATEMKKEEIIDMYLSGKFKADDKVLWSDIRADWPKEEIKFYGPNENHGTYEFFHETILKKAEMVKTANLQQEYSTLVDLVSKDKNAIAFFGFGYYVSNKDKLTAVKVDFGNGPVDPTLETIGEDLAYAGFTRPVFTYLNVNYAKEKPQVLDYAKYVVSAEGCKRLAGQNGFAPLPDSVYAEYQKQLEAIK
ncbi:PstS family phosphate ABC transporter substrate-binding protein [Petroclostridium sp. X23]|jgi:phosphate transport system substrate-binding protein|uniref:PstS family phosphate ABC transporter substrate-binding protein n=1 Tax=Petroclostridium sp. X23 TaxID=3045146 RepID=UPI0024AE87C0|nr:PstS family phosphate ABC transporter substrate-binding protein [Petroclostridium sp. X23]WHH61217.1 PstS family phosphate ABC transporter substrate-binding protein [Petroclostridium sp. X23]